VKVKVRKTHAGAKLIFFSFFNTEKLFNFHVKVKDFSFAKRLE